MPSTQYVPSSLENDYELMFMVVRRNRNQHRNQPFFKDLDILRKSVHKLLETRRECVALQIGALSSVDAEGYQRRFEKEAQLRSRRDYLTEHIRDVLVPKAFVSMRGLIRDVQFAHLAIVLVGILGSIAKGKEGVGLPVKPVEIQIRSNKLELGKGFGQSVVSSRQIVTGDDMGEVVERHMLAGDQKPSSSAGSDSKGTPFTTQDFEQSTDLVINEKQHTKAKTGGDVSKPSKHRNKEKSKGRKKGTSKNAIDDLFDGLI